MNRTGMFFILSLLMGSLVSSVLFLLSFIWFMVRVVGLLLVYSHSNLSWINVGTFWKKADQKKWYCLNNLFGYWVMWYGKWFAAVVAFGTSGYLETWSTDYFLNKTSSYHFACPIFWYSCYSLDSHVVIW